MATFDTTFRIGGAYDSATGTFTGNFPNGGQPFDVATTDSDPSSTTYEPGETITFTLSGFTFTNTFVGWYADGFLAQTGSSFLYYSNSPVAPGEQFTISTDPFTVCFAAGTLIETDRGPVPVEALRAGDCVRTLADAATAHRPVLWIGRRHVELDSQERLRALAPIRIRAGALGDNAPGRDLLVSPDHCLLLDGRLVPARLLENGVSIVQELHHFSVQYFHIELECHDVVLAEGVPAESWLDCGNRAWFANAPQALLRVDAAPDAYAAGPATPCAPLLHGGPELASIRDGIAARIPAVVESLVAAGVLRRVA